MRCEEFAKRGTGYGACDRPLDEHGYCDRPGDHIELGRACSALSPGHRHCVHGHTEDCPDPENCDLLPR